MSTFDRLTACFARTLEPEEREAVLGDLAESQEAGLRAVWEVLNLAARRQAGIWRRWRPWPVAIVLVIPTALILSAVAGYMSHLAGIYGWMYLANWESSYLTNPGARADLLHYLTVALTYSGAVAAWSWAAGFAAGSLARRAVPGIGLLAALTLFAVQPNAHGISFGVNDAAFHSLVTAWLLPVLTRALLILLPAFGGLALGSRWTVFQRPSGPARRAAYAVRPLLLAATLIATAVLDWSFRLRRLP
jgi:hypothetical protein